MITPLLLNTEMNEIIVTKATANCCAIGGVLTYLPNSINNTDVIAIGYNTNNTGNEPWITVVKPWFEIMKLTKVKIVTNHLYEILVKFHGRIH